ncbi:MAG TPA: hypothetical protein VLG44_06580, partial [Chlamydiales bacterium]|nr:hypothetical protein [Chlamydiales bacterium]
MKRTKIKEIAQNPALLGKKVYVCGWIKTVRDQKTFAFIELNDGSTFSNFQIISNDQTLLPRLTTGASI